MTLGKKLASELVPGDVVALTGDLGAGKTALIQAITQALNIRDYVNSPTFTIVNQYRAQPPLRFVNHIDFYRIKHPAELAEIGLDEYFNATDITLIEWADLFPDQIPGSAWRIDVAVEDEKRIFTVTQ